MGRDHQHLELVDLVEFLGLGHGRPGHPGQLVVQAEEILEGDGGQRLVLLLDLDAFLGLHGLVQAVAPAAAGHLPAGELVDDDDLAVLHDVVAVALVQEGGLQRLVDLVRLLDVLQLVDVLDPGPALDLGNPLFGEGGRLGLLFHGVVARREPGDQAGILVVLLGGVVGLPRDDERRARLIDQDAVHLVHDGVVQRSLDALGQLDRHVVAQVVETKLIVGAVGDVGGVRLLAADGPQVLQPRVGVGLVQIVRVIPQRHLVADDRHRHAQPVVDGAVPAGVAASQVVVDRDQVGALTLQRVEIEGQHGHQGLALAGLHLGDGAMVQHHAPHQLDIEWAQPDRPAGSLSDHGEGLHQQVVDRLAGFQPLAELGRLGLQLGVGQRLDQWLQLSDLAGHRQMALDLSGVRVPEDLGENAHRKKDAKLGYPAVAGANRRSPDPPVRRRRSGCGACRAKPGSAASAPEMQA